jgi:hypothetical protein
VAATAGVKNFALSFVKMDFLTGTVLPVGAGFAGTKLVAGVVLPWLLKPSAEKRAKMDAAAIEKADKRWAFVQKYQPAFEIGLAIASGAVVGMVTKKPQFAVKWVTGGAIAALSTLIDRSEWFQKKTSTLKGTGLGQVSSQTKEELSKEVEKAIDRAEGGGYGGLREYATVDEYASSDDIAGGGQVGAYLTEDDLQTTRSAPGMTFDEFGGLPNGL